MNLGDAAQASPMGVERAAGPRRPAPSDFQIKHVEQTLRQVWFWAQKMSDGSSRLGMGMAPIGPIEGAGREAMLKEATRSIIDAFGMEQLPVR